MPSEMIGSVTTGIDLNETKAVESINRLKSAVKDATREWQINEAQAKSAGDAITASKARYDGLSDAIEKQKSYINNLSEGMNTINRDTEAGEKAYQKYNSQLSTAERSLASMTGQLNRAKAAYEYQQTGIEELNKSLTANDKLMQSQIDLYDKTKNKMGAAKAEVAGLSGLYTKQTEIYQAQVAELKRLETAEGTSNEALVKQKTRVNEAASAVLGYRNRLAEVNLAIAKIHPFSDNNIVGQSLNGVYTASNKVTNAMSAGFEKVKNAAYSSAFGVAAIGAAAVKGAQMASDLQNQYKTTFNLLITGGEQAKEAQKNVNKMQEQGSELSVKYGKTQKEIADGYQELVKRGYTSAQALGALPTMLQASVASGDEFTDVVHNSTAALESFGKRADDVTGMTKNTKEVVNQMAYAADMTATDFQSMGVAMEYVGASAHQSKLSLSETASAIGILSNNGLEADKAGTGLRKVIVSLQSPTKAASDALAGIGLSTKDFVDQHGNMKSMTDIFELLNKHTEKLSSYQQGQIFHALFGTTGQQAGSILSANVKQLAELDDKVKKSADGQGYVVNLANKNMQSTQNELKQFKAAGEAALIMIGQKFLPVLSDAATSMAKAFNSKDGREGLETIASGVAAVSQGIIDIVKFIGTHKQEVIDIAKAFAGIWAVKKIGDALVLVQKINKELKIMSGMNALSNALAGGSSSKVGGTAITEAESVGTTALRTGAAGDVGAIASTGALSKVTSLLPKLLAFVGSIGGSTILSGGFNAATELFSKDNTSEKVGGVAGSLGGAAAGAAIGTLIAPGIGTAIGAALGGMGGKDIGKKLGDAIKSGIELSDIRSGKLPVVKFDINAPTAQMKTFSNDYQNFIKKINTSAATNIVDPKSLKDAEQQTNSAFAAMSKSIDSFYKKQEADSKNNLKVLLDNGAINQTQYNELYKKQVAADKSAKTDLKNSQSEMENDTKNYYAKVQSLQKSNSSQQQALQKSHAAALSSIENGSNATLQAIAQKYGKNSKAYLSALNAEMGAENTKFAKQKKDLENSTNAQLTAAHKKYTTDMETAENKMNSQISTATKIAQNQQLDTLTNLQNQKRKLNQKQLIDIVETANDEFTQVKKKAQDQKDAVVKAANDKYKQTVAAADKERAENSNMSKAQYDAIVNNAKKQRTDSVNAANDQYSKTVNAAQKTHDKTIDLANSKADANVKAAAKEQGETVAQYTQGFSDSRNAINSFVDAINGVLNFLHKGWGKIPQMSKFATGTQGLSRDEIALVGEEGFELAHNSKKGIFAVGLNGPEVRHLDAGTSILPNSMSKQFLSMASQLPAHADGIQGFLNGVFNDLKDVSSVIAKGPQAVVDSAYNAIGLNKLANSFPPVVVDMANGIGATAKDDFVNFVKSFFSKAQQDGGGSQGAPSGSGVQRWASQVKEALAANGLSTSDDMVNKVLRQIATESSGDPSAVQHGYTDVNTISGDLAKGLMQTTSSTFNAHAFPGHKDIFNGYDNLLAALAYAKARYGPDLSYLGQGHGYANGGLISKHGLYEIAEGNHPEMVIPLDPQKKSRATQLLSQANKTINNQSNENPSNDIVAVLSQAVALLSQLTTTNAAQLSALKNMPTPVIDATSVFMQAAPIISKTQQNYQTIQNILRGKTL